MRFQKFKEYLDDKKNLQQKPIVSVDADTGPEGNKPVRPPKAVTKGKNWKNFQRSEGAQVEDGGNGAENQPYSAPGKDPGQLTADGDAGKANPLGDKGEKNLIYNPKVADQTLRMKKMHPTTAEDTKTEQFLSATRGLTTERYAEYVLKQQDAKGVKQVIETTDIVHKSPALIETLVREMKRKGDFSALVESLLQQPEFYAIVGVALAEDKNVAKALAKAVNEITAEPAEEDIVPEKPASKSMPAKNDSINARGKPVESSVNARHAKTVKGTPVQDGNVMMSKKQYVMMRPEHNLVEALGAYGAIRATMKKLVD